MEIREMDIFQLETRMGELTAELDKEDANLEEIRSEMDAIEERKAQLETEAKEAAELRAAAAAETKSVKTFEEEEERKTMTNIEMRATAEYRDAFYAMIAGTATEEQRTIVVDNTAPGNGDAIAIPKSLDEKIWDGIHTAHPILADIATVRSGVAMEVTKHTAIAARTTKKADKDANAGEEENTFVKVVLYGYDYEKYVELTYAEAKMSQGALEDYLAQEIAAEIGEALAKDVFAQIETDATTAQKVTDTNDAFADIKSALALAKTAGVPVIYAPASKYYDIVGAIKSGAPFNIGATLGCEVKLDNAAAHVTVVDPKMFVLNEVQAVIVESDRDVKNHKVVVSGYMRAQGTLRKNNAAAYIA